MPYYGDDYGGKLKLQHGLKKRAVPNRPSGEISCARGRQACRCRQLKALALAVTVKASNANGSSRRPRVDAAPAPDAPYGDGPPCLQTLAASSFPDKWPGITRYSTSGSI